MCGPYIIIIFCIKIKLSTDVVSSFESFMLGDPYGN